VNPGDDDRARDHHSGGAVVGHPTRWLPTGNGRDRHADV
jgi:hypothetical protein